MYYVFTRTCLTLAAAALELSWSPLRSKRGVYVGVLEVP